MYSVYEHNFYHEHYTNLFWNTYVLPSKYKTPEFYRMPVMQDKYKIELIYTYIKCNYIKLSELCYLILIFSFLLLGKFPLRVNIGIQHF